MNKKTPDHSLPISKPLLKKIKDAHADVQHFFFALQDELSKLQKHILRLQKEKMSYEASIVALNTRIQTLEEDLKVYLAMKSASDDELQQLRSKGAGGAV